MSIEVRVNSGEVDSAIRSAFVGMAGVFNYQLNQSIVNPLYPWPRGRSPRPILDTGALRDSQTQGDVQGDASSSLSITWDWPVHYAGYVHNGVVLRNGSIMPPRKWTEKAIEMKSPVLIFEELLRARL
jgi:hypothetical protein